jgi:hypothetical protein
MHYGITREATDFTRAGMSGWRVKTIKTLLFFVPRANPDNEEKYPDVRAWALELSDDGIPLREVGVSGSGEALFRAPNSRNTGFWTDMASQKFQPEQLDPLSPDEFSSLWQAAEQREPAQ